MDYLKSMMSSMRSFYQDAGAIDVICVEHEDGTLNSTPFHVRFGKMSCLSAREKIVEICINDEPVDNIRMKLAIDGVAFFLKKVEAGTSPDAIPDHLADSPIPDASDTARLIEDGLAKERRKMTAEEVRSDDEGIEIEHRRGKDVEHEVGVENDDIWIEWIKNRYQAMRIGQLQSNQWNWGELPIPDTDDEKRPSSQPTSIEGLYLKSYLDSMERGDKLCVGSSPTSPAHQIPLRNRTFSDGCEPISTKEQKQFDQIHTQNYAQSTVDGNNPNSSQDSVHHRYYTGQLAFAAVLSRALFKQPLPESFISSLAGAEEEPLRRDPKIITPTKKASTRLTLQVPEKQEQNNDIELPKQSNKVPLVKAKSSSLPRSINQPVQISEGIHPVGIRVPLEVDADAADPDLGSESEVTKYSPSYLRSLRLTSDKLKEMKLKPGKNEVKYSITSKYQGTTYCLGHIYLFKWYDKLVISDIDGTITKSDVLGHFLYLLGGQWAQSGVAKFFSHIKNNGYKIVYLSSRPIGQSDYTRDCLKRVDQSSYRLPEGPALISPDSLFTALHREVIAGNPELFKISCLQDLAEQFPPVSEPFYAGFGNNKTDVLAYKSINLPLNRIFQIYPTGELVSAAAFSITEGYQLSTVAIDTWFPPITPMREEFHESRTNE